jgi:peptidoglycan/LPS O-acetylase OafA/YrhL
VRLEFIDGLRGIAILLVLLRHYYIGTYMEGLPRWFDALGLGYLGVHLFLLLSGFCIAWPYVGPSKREFTFGDFFSRRATRILPAYYVALFIALILALPMDSQEIVTQVATHLTMTHNLFKTTVLALNGPFWSLALEFQLYLLFPLMLFAYRRSGLLLMLLSVFFLQTCFRTYVALHFGTQYSDTTFVLPWSVAGRMFDFALGVLAARVLAEPCKLNLARRWKTEIGLLSVLLLGGAIISKRYMGETSPVTDLSWSSAFLCILIVSSFPDTIVNRFISLRPLVYLGIFSYSVYLVHILILEYFTTPIRASFSATIVVALTIPTILVTIACCYFFYRAVEKPSIDFFGNRRRRFMEIAK